VPSSVAAEAVDELETSHASRPMTAAVVRRLLPSLGWTAADIRHAKDLAAVCKRLGEDRVIPMIVRHSAQAGKKAERSAVRTLLQMLGG